MTLNERQQAGAELQRKFNEMARHKSVAAIRAEMLKVLAEQYAPYPQYEGHWDEWQVGQITRQCRTKLGVAFEPADVTLIQTGTNISGHDTAHSFRNGWDTQIGLKKVICWGQQ